MDTENDKLFIADTNNHTVKVANILNRNVEMVTSHN
jgi:hypothetical protein